VLVLLPPSEGKADANRKGRPLDLTALSLPELTPARERVVEALIRLSAGPDEPARTALGLSSGQTDELRRNVRLRKTTAMPAERVYSGVLYEALELSSLGPAARRRARGSILVFSALFGAVRITDRIPPYRCSAGVRLPEVGPLGAYWRENLDPVLPPIAGSGLVLDLRSSAYAPMWQPTGALAERTVAVRVLHERVVGGVVSRSVVSHFNKATKGRLVRDLLATGARPRTPAALVEALRDLKYTVEEQAAVRGRVRRLDLVVAEL
jgi:cytoplasmic iron level regulating protein YaaA (DUF328/UPF0246 family)